MLYLIGSKWFDGNLQAIAYNFGIMFWILSEIVIFSMTREKKGNLKEKSKSFDEFSIYILMAGNIISCIVALIGTTYLQAHISAVFSWIGIVLLYLGVCFRDFSVWTLRRYFTVKVKIKADHKIIKNGPYKFIRHPAYSGSILSLLGMQLGARNIIAIIMVVVLATVIYSYRISVEEKALVNNFGEEYLEYIKTTKKVIPFIY